MTKERCRKAIDNKGYQVSYDMSAHAYIAYKRNCGGFIDNRSYHKAETLNALYNQFK